MERLDYDQTDIHLRDREARQLPAETIRLWMEALSKHVPRGSTNVIPVSDGCRVARRLQTMSSSKGWEL